MSVSSFQKSLQLKIHSFLQKSKEFRVIMPDEVSIAFGSSIGLVREENQDNVLVARVQSEYRNQPDQYIIAVLCDGMGGMAHGKQCADLALSVFTASFVLNTDLNYPKRLEFAVNDANTTVFHQFSGKGGSTLSAVMVSESGFKAAINVGDSRIYQILTDGTVKQISIDDTLEAQLANFKEAINIQSRELRQLSKFIGIGDNLDVKSITIETSPEINSIMLTTDGIHNIISQELIKQIIIYGKDAQDITQKLIDLSEWLGGKDNATMIYLPLSLKLESELIDNVKLNVEIWNLYKSIDFCIADPINLNREYPRQQVQKKENQSHGVTKKMETKPKNLDTQKRKSTSQGNGKANSPKNKSEQTQLKIEIVEGGDVK